MAHENQSVRCELVNHQDTASRVAPVVKKLPGRADVRGAGLVPGSGRPPGEGKAAHSVRLPGESRGRRSWRAESTWSQSRTGLSGDHITDTAPRLALVVKSPSAEAGDVRFSGSLGPGDSLQAAVAARPLQDPCLGNAHGQGARRATADEPTHHAHIHVRQTQRGNLNTNCKPEIRNLRMLT